MPPRPTTRSPRSTTASPPTTTTSGGRSGLLGLAYGHGLSGRRVLDAGCGTGKSFLPLLERGFEVTACDQSPAMLELAAAKAAGRVTLHLSDLRTLEPIGEFDLITCLDDVANYLTEPDDLTAALAALAQNLRPNGLLLFDANTLRAIATSSARPSWSRRTGP